MTIYHCRIKTSAMKKYKTYASSSREELKKRRNFMIKKYGAKATPIVKSGSNYTIF